MASSECGAVLMLFVEVGFTRNGPGKKEQPNFSINVPSMENVREPNEYCELKEPFVESWKDLSEPTDIS